MDNRDKWKAGQLKSNQELLELLDKRRCCGKPKGRIEAELAKRFFTPDNITIIVSLISATIGITTTAIKGIALWIEERKSRKIKIKYKDIELEITGGLSKSEIMEKLLIFGESKEQIEKKDVDIVIV